MFSSRQEKRRVERMKQRWAREKKLPGHSFVMSRSPQKTNFHRTVAMSPKAGTPPLIDKNELSGVLSLPRGRLCVKEIWADLGA
jgi:hypothetical protein